MSGRLPNFVPQVVYQNPYASYAGYQPSYLPSSPYYSLTPLYRHLMSRSLPQAPNAYLVYPPTVAPGYGYPQAIYNPQTAEEVAGLSADYENLSAAPTSLTDDAASVPAPAYSARYPESASSYGYGGPFVYEQPSARYPYISFGYGYPYYQNYAYGYPYYGRYADHDKGGASGYRLYGNVGYGYPFTQVVPPYYWPPRYRKYQYLSTPGIWY